MRASLLAILLAAAALAGCSDDPKTDTVDEPDFGGVKATETTGLIRGVVVDLAVRPIPGVNVSLAEPARAAVTDDQGAFAFDGLAPGDYFLTATKFGFTQVQTSATVVAGVDEPPIVKIALEELPSQQPYVESRQYAGYLNFGVAIGITSIGSTFLGGLPNDYAIWNAQYTQVPAWAQGELVWDQTQQAGGMLIWEMVKGGSNDWRGYRETAESPALAFWNTTVLQAEAENVTDTDQGIDYRFFGGPHPLLAPNHAGGPFPPQEQCPVIPTVVLGDRNPCRFGFGVTLQQRADAYVHEFYNFVPPEGWRFTTDGEPVVPTT